MGLKGGNHASATNCRTSRIAGERVAAAGPHQTVAGIEVDQCPECQGIYFDQGELDQLLASDGAAGGTDNPEYSAMSDQKDMELGTCPRCNQEMEPCLGPANLRIDRCSSCNAVFLDQGELSELLSAQE